jgi:glycine/D-amino acid oxidase-like deaminating enzyme
MHREYDVIVAGAGMVGAAIAYGLAGQDKRVLMLDGADTDFRAAKANFGLVWVQGKGYKYPEYHRLSAAAADAWPEFAERLEAESGISLDYQTGAGLKFCLSDEELSARAKMLDAWHAETPELRRAVQILDRSELERRYPMMRIGPDVAGASLGEQDGHVNPLRLLAALQTAFQRRGGSVRNGHPVTSIKPLSGGGFEVQTAEQTARAERVVISAGLGSLALGRMVGLDIPLHPERGQILVTERLAPVLPVPASGIRQTGEGTVMIGVTEEHVGYDLSTTSDAAVRMTKKALRILPDLGKARLVRHWSCLRVMTPDGYPVYASSPEHPGAVIATCHSGLTLASFHAGAYAQAFGRGAPLKTLNSFHHDRFNVSKNQSPQHATADAHH